MSAETFTLETVTPVSQQKVADAIGPLIATNSCDLGNCVVTPKYPAGTCAGQFYPGRDKLQVAAAIEPQAALQPLTV